MRKRNEGNFAVIREFVDRYFLENQRSPSTREIEAGTGIPRATAQRCLRLMSESGEISYGKRRGIETDLSRKIGDSVSVTLYESTVSCGAPNEPYDITKKEHRQRLIDTFINAVFLYDDRILITFNHQNGQKTISMEEANGSDFKNILRPYRVFITDLTGLVWTLDCFFA